MIRLRLPGGVISASALAELAAVATDFSGGQVQLTSRGNLQLRGVPVDRHGVVGPELVARIVEAGLLPSPTHELVRNVVCSPLTGRVGGRADLRPLLAELDAQLCADPGLADLPGRFLFALDDGRGDVFPLAHDLGVVAADAGAARLSVAGILGASVPLDGAVTQLLILARRFLERRGTAWHLRELDEPLLPRPSEPTRPAAHPLDFGRLIQSDGRGLLSLGVPLATLTADQIAAVTAVADRVGSGRLIVTPWRGLLVPDLGEEVTDLESVGFLLDPLSSWRGITACVGAPGCARAGGATRPIATLLARTSSTAVGPDVHVVACGRRCGAPAADHIEVLADSSGFTVSGRPGRPDIHCGAAELADIVALARNGS